MNAIAKTIVTLLSAVWLAACTTTPVADHCQGDLGRNLNNAIQSVESRLNNGCTYHFDRYFGELLEVATANPDPLNKSLFSDFLVRTSDNGTISKSQARELYNRYFNIKFVSFTGDYNTCSQACPVQAQLLADMQSELRDKQVGLMEAAQDKQSYYRADHLLKETQLVLEATCRACNASGGEAR
ncbi:MAG: hypothetical protein AAF529_08390 [Pseudomonadota bacterium]